MKKLSIFLMGVLLMVTPTAEATADNRYTPWLVYYANEVPIDAFDDYQLIVLDSDNHPPLAELKQSGKLILGYISLGEVASYRDYFAEVSSEGILLGENPYWKGSYFVDLRSGFWIKKVIEQLIPNILQQGFDGIFIDTLDNPPYLESKDPVKFKGMVKAASRLVKSIRLYFPYTKIMLNRAYPLIEDVAPHLDMLLGESIFADYNFDSKTYQKVEKKQYLSQVKLLQNALRLNPNLGIYTLDYWNPEDKKMLTKIYKTQRQNGFIPYVSTLQLDKIIKEPK